MTKRYALSAETRDRAGKGVARALRRENKIPAVIYGDAKEAQSIALPVKEVTMEYHKGHLFTNLCDLSVGDAKNLVLARDVQLCPVTDRVLHVDFMRVTPRTTITARVPVHFANADTAPGVKAGGSLNVVAHELELICRATEIPEGVEIDVGQCQIGDTIKMSDIKLPSGAKSASAKDATIATIAPPRLTLEEEDAINAAKAAAEADAAADADAAEGDKAEGDKK